jgi:hypothetical protein
MDDAKAGRYITWAGACIVSLLTIAALIPPGFLVWLLAFHDTGDWVTNHAQHVASVRIAMLMIAFPAGGALLGGLATLPARHSVSAAGRASATATGALLASLLLTIGGGMWMLGHSQFTY